MKHEMTKWGVGPLFTVLSIGWSLIVLMFILIFGPDVKIKAIPNWMLSSAGIALITAGIPFYISALIKVMRAFKDGKLVTEGVFGACRHPVYASWIIFFTPGILLILNQPLGFIVPLAMYIILRKLVKEEEVYLENVFGIEYMDYQKRVPPVLPIGWLTSKKAQNLATITLVFAFSLFFQACALQPIEWTPPETPERIGPFKSNERLSTTEKIDLKGWYGPEDVAVDKEGNLYAGVHIGKKDFSSGSVIKIDKRGKISVFCKTDSWVAGLHFDSMGNLIACDQKRGLISIDHDGKIKVLANKDENGNPFLIPNDIDIASGGTIYFTNTSSKIPFSIRNVRKIILEVKPDGGLYSYSPKTKKVKTLIDGSFFGNGVAVSQEEDFVLMVDLTKYRVRRHWLKGPKKGQTDMFIDNLPGIPNGISRRVDGTFWLGFTTCRNTLLDFAHPNPLMKKFVYALPLWMQPDQEAFGIIMHLNEDGDVLETLYDTTGKYVSEASSIEEHDGYLYIGGDMTGHIGKYKLIE